MTSLPIEFPEGFVSLVKEGDTIIVGQVLAQKQAPKEVVLNILQSLNLSRRQAKKILKKSPGDQINPGDIIAIKKNLFGQIQATITSQIAGVILRYERDTGNLVVQMQNDPASFEIISPVAGIITLCNNKEIVIETKDAIVSAGTALGVSGAGPLFILQESFGENNTDNASALYYLDGRAEGKIVLVKTLTRDLLIKGDSIGVAGFLSVEISSEDIEYVQLKEIQLPVLEVNDELIAQLHPWENKKVLIDISTKAVILQE